MKGEGMNNHGHVVGVADRFNEAEAMLWTPATGMIGLGDLPGGVFRSGAGDVSADGPTVVGYNA
ncbi:hypothetical protein LCGC14_2546810, partial [marine sediment metagenome]